MNCINPGDSILVIWNNQDQKTISDFVQQVKRKAENGFVVLENSEMITEDSRPHSSFELVISNWLSPYTVKHTDSLLALIIKLLKPCGKLLLKDETDLMSTLKLNGFVNVILGLNNIYIAEKPNFEVGSRASLKLKNSKPAVWKLDDNVEAAWTGIDDDETIDDDQLLDEDDLKKPDKQSLRVCATTGKRKACADCVCGLADELRGVTKQTPKSSCGSCYLGDAFRCANCPYLGMPAFKPGDKVMLDLKSDI